MTMPNLPDTPIRLTGPADLIAAVPHLLGFHPADSLVLVGVDNGLITVVARLDCTPARPTVDELHGALDVLRRAGSTDLVSLAYTESTSPPECRTAAHVLGNARDAGLDLLDHLTVTGSFWRSELCPDPACCPPTGHELGTDLRAQAEWAVRGSAPLPSREALTALVAPLSATDPRRVNEPDLRAVENEWTDSLLTNGPASTVRSAIRSLFSKLRAGQSLSNAQAAAHAVALQCFEVRDAVWLALDARRLTGDPVLRDLATRIPAPYSAAPLFLYAWAQWRDGNGAAASVAVAAALDADPNYTAADLLLAALNQGIDPRRLPRLRATGEGRARR
jgi:hypothetical protein